MYFSLGTLPTLSNDNELVLEHYSVTLETFLLLRPQQIICCLCLCYTTNFTIYSFILYLQNAHRSALNTVLSRQEHKLMRKVRAQRSLKEGLLPAAVHAGV